MTASRSLSTFRCHCALCQMCFWFRFGAFEDNAETIPGTVLVVYLDSLNPPGAVTISSSDTAKFTYIFLPDFDEILSTSSALSFSQRPTKLQLTKTADARRVCSVNFPFTNFSISSPRRRPTLTSVFDSLCPIKPSKKMAREASPPEPCSRTRRQTSPLPFLRPYRRMPAQQLPPRPTTSPAALPTGRVRGDRGLRRLGSGSPSPESTTTTTKMATRKALPGNTSVEAGDYTYAEEEERGPHGFTVPSPVSPPTDLISCPQSDSGYECSPLEQPPSYFPTPPIPSDRCPSQYHKGQRLNSHTRSISDSAIPSDPNGSSCTYHRDWTPQPLPAGIARPPGHPPTRDAIFAPPATPYPLALAGVNVVARPWTSGSSSSSSPTSFRSNKSSGSGSPIDWSPFRAKAATTAREGEAAKLWGWKRSLPWGLGSISQSHSTGGREGSNEAMTPLRAAPAPPLLPSRIRSPVIIAWYDASVGAPCPRVAEILTASCPHSFGAMNAHCLPVFGPACYDSCFQASMQS
ncbi:hypothetical protein IWX50DRAFT_632324 [Phyllosticta citricarpa]